MARAGLDASVNSWRSVVVATLSTEGSGSPIQCADQSTFSSRPIDQVAGALQSDRAPSWSQTRTFQKSCWRLVSGAPWYSIWFWWVLAVFPEFQRSALSAARLAGVLATSI